MRVEIRCEWSGSQSTSAAKRPQSALGNAPHTALRQSGLVFPASRPPHRLLQGGPHTSPARWTPHQPRHDGPTPPLAKWPTAPSSKAAPTPPPARRPDTVPATERHRLVHCIGHNRLAPAVQSITYLQFAGLLHKVVISNYTDQSMSGITGPVTSPCLV